jgi:hypothetical protein
LIARLMKQSDFDGHGIGRAVDGGHFAANPRRGRWQAESPKMAVGSEREPRGELNDGVRSTGLVGDEAVCGSPFRQTNSRVHAGE